jgi:hypothetical protein
MSYLRACQKMMRGRLALIALLPACVISFAPGTACAQTAPHKRESPRAIILPHRVVAGAQASLAVLDASSRLLPGITVALPGGQTVKTDATGRALFTGPAVSGDWTATIPGTAISADTAAVGPDAPEAHPAAEGGLPVAKVISYPRALSIHERFEITGVGFRGAADANRAFLGDERCLVLAASPVSLIVLPGPGTPIGETSLRITVPGIEVGRFPVSTVLLDFSGPAETPAAGSEGRLTLHVHGSAQPLRVEVHNSSPRIIQFPAGNSQRLVTSGGEPNTAAVELKFLAPGDYIATARLLPESASPAPH